MSSQFKLNAGKLQSLAKGALNRSQFVRENLLARHIKDLKRLQTEVCKISAADKARQLTQLFDQIALLLSER